MSKVLFLNGNVHGHINPTLALVSELVRRGEEVSYFSTAEFADQITVCGAEFMDYGDELNDFFTRYRPSGNHPFYGLLEFILEMDRAVLPIVIRKTEGLKFDYIIHDSIFGAGNFVARKLGLPAICSSTAFAMDRLPMPPHMFQPGFHPHWDAVSDKMEKASDMLGVPHLQPMDLFFKKEKLNIVYTSSYFQPGSEAFDESFRFVGPSIRDGRAQAGTCDENAEVEVQLSKLPKDRPLIYISLGTINNRYSGFYNQCFNAFGSMPVSVVMSVGTKIDMTELDEVPDNFLVYPRVPQLAVLRQASLFISHGGLNSVSEALYNGVPVIAVPIANDQPMVTKQLVSLGAGLTLKMDEVTPELLRSSVDTILGDAAYSAASRKIGDTFLEAGGYRAAADHILTFKTMV